MKPPLARIVHQTRSRVRLRIAEKRKAGAAGRRIDIALRRRPRSDQACVVGFDVSKHPPWSMATSTRTEPGVIRHIYGKRFGFGEPTHHPFESRASFTAPGDADFLMTESNVIAAVEYGHRSGEEIRGWLEEELSGLFQGEARAVAFGGYIQLLQRL